MIWQEISISCTVRRKSTVRPCFLDVAANEEPTSLFPSFIEGFSSGCSGLPWPESWDAAWEPLECPPASRGASALSPGWGAHSAGWCPRTSAPARAVPSGARAAPSPCSSGTELCPALSEERFTRMQMPRDICMQTRSFVANEGSFMLLLLRLRDGVEETKSCAGAALTSSERRHRAAVGSKFHSAPLVLLFFPCF